MFSQSDTVRKSVIFKQLTTLFAALYGFPTFRFRETLI